MPSIPFITSIKNVSADVTTAELTDLSTGYGVGGNPARNELALYAYLYKRDAALADTVVAVDNSDPLNVSVWAFDLVGDGWYVAIIFGFPVWVAGSYATNECVYHNGVYYRATTSTNQQPPHADWDDITDIQSEVLNLGSANVYITQTNNFTTAIIESGKAGDVLQALGQKIIQGKIKNSDDCASALYVAGLLESAWVNFRRGDSQDAQEIVDYITGQWRA